MSEQNLNGFIQALEWRYATKQFDPAKRIDEPVVQRLLDVLRLSPSSFGLQPWRFLVISDPALRARLQPHAWNQSQITDASHLVVLCGRNSMDADYINSFIERTASERQIPAQSLDGYRQMMLSCLPMMQGEKGQAWMTHQVYLALGFLMSAAAAAGVDSCPMEGFSREDFDRELGLTGSEFGSRVLCALGYRSASDSYATAKKVRFELAEVCETR